MLTCSLDETDEGMLTHSMQIALGYHNTWLKFTSG